MEPYPIEPLLVRGTAGQYAVAWLEPRQYWLVLRLTPRPDGHPVWTWVDSDAHEAGARLVALQRYLGDLKAEAMP